MMEHGTKGARRGRSAPARARGFTLVELMVVVAIIGILASVAVVNATGQASLADDTRTASYILREVSRRAVSAGPIRADVAAATGVTARARAFVWIDGASGRTVMTIDRLEEQPAPTADYEWVEMRRHVMARGVRLAGFSASAATEPGAAVEPVGEPLTVECATDGTCTPLTLFFEGPDGQRARIAILPLNGNALVFDGW